MKIKSKIWLEIDNGLVFGSGRLAIFKAIEDTGSMNQAAEKLGMSYRRLWGFVTAVENRLGKRLIIRRKGGKNGGGAVLTEEAQAFVLKFSRLEKDVHKYADKTYREIFAQEIDA